MFCTISGQIPEEPVVSRTSGLLFEKRLILKALVASGGKCPETGEPLSEDDLIDVKVSGKLSKPTKSTIGNIPNLLAHLQSEYDSITLENHAGKKLLSKTRQELAHALYQFDAATRIIEALTKEKTDLENALHKSFETKHHEQHAQVNNTPTKRKISLQVASGGESNTEGNDDKDNIDIGDGEAIEIKVGEHRNAKRRKESGEYKITNMDKPQGENAGNGNDAMNADMEAKSALKDSSLLADATLVEIEKQSKVLLGERKIRKASPSLEKSSVVKAFTCTAKGLPYDDRQIPAPITSLAFADAASASVVVGRTDGAVTLVNAETLKTEKIIATKLGRGISVLKRVPREDRNAVVCGRYDGCVEVIDTAKDYDGDNNNNGNGNSKVVDLGFHPNGNLVLSVLEDGKWRWTDVNEIGKKLMGRSSGDASAKYASGSVHGDGILFATGCTNGTIEMWDIRTGKTLAQYKDAELNSHENAVGVTGLDMSENGYYLASAINGTVAIWDLRKHKILRQYEFDSGSTNMDVAIDYSGVYGTAVTRKKTVLFTTKRKSNVLKTFEHEELNNNNDIVNIYRPGLLWGENAKFVLSGQSDGCVYRYGTQ